MLQNKLASAIKRYFSRQDDISAVYVYGSQATGKAGPLSDVDVAVAFCHDPRDRAFDKEVRFRIDLEKILGRNMDVIVLNQADLVLAFQVYSKGEPLMVRKKKEAESLKWRQIRSYWDYLPIKRMYEQTLFRRMTHGH